ncbi:MAG: BatA domain-containing protein [Balneola sp.]|nr:BatA domain-containing protein [Balneola sp.]MBO6651695.1 BatA domain-containing protein [Balneola sp.]MBO6712867.1 BatA domain-containing protein [Balneola sp.]MBO6801166.1 BatA domain-containing protein [Balneola sp.]MBO6871358.1 BatA domain-containing protein [Balneola sp.]
MSFLNPVFLFALVAVGLPLIIHLLNLRKPTRVQFSTLAFFKELQKSTIRKIKIKRLLLLALRLLAIACLAMVLARPFLPPILSVGSSSNQPAIHAILLDNSISMNRIGSKGPLSDQAKELVMKILDASKDADRFIIQTTNGAPVNASVSIARQIERKLNEIEVVKKGAFLSERLNNLTSILEETPFQNKNLYIIDDRNPELISVLNNSFEDRISEFGVSILHVEDVKTQNTFISDVTSSSSMVGKGIPFTLEVSVKNEGDIIAANQFLTLTVEGSTIGQYSLQIEPGATQEFSFEVNPDKSGSITGIATIEGDGFSFDNEYFFSIQVPEKRDILWVTKKSDNPGEVSYTSVILDAQLEGNNQINYTRATSDEVSGFNVENFDALILEGLDEVPEFLFQEIQEFVQNGKGLVFFPSETADIQNYNDFLTLFNAGSFVGVLGDFTSFNTIAKGSTLLEDHPVFDGLFNRDSDEELNFAVPDIYYYLKLRTNNSGLGLNIIEMNNGDPLLREKKFGEGRVLIFSVGNNPSWTNFPVKALYAPTYYRTMLYAASLEEGGLSNQFLGKSFEWRGNADLQTTELVYENESIQITPQNVGGAISVSYQGYEWEPGWVSVTDEINTFKTALNLAQSESVFNSEGSGESVILENINIVDSGTLTSEELTNEIRSTGFGKEVWHWFMMAGFLLLVTESLVSIFYKAETVA